MSNVRFAKGGDNRTIAATIINGNGGYGGAPAKSEQAQYPMANLLINDRAAIWRTDPALVGGFGAELDLGADYDIDVVAVHGFRHAAGQTIPNTVDVGYRTAAQGYGAVWTLAKAFAIASPQRDIGQQLSAPKRGRYWRFYFGSSGGGFGCSNFYLGLLSHDLGILYSPNALDQLNLARIRTMTMMRMPIFTRIGDNTRSFALPYDSVLKPTADILRALAAETVPFTYLSPFDEIFQAELQGESHQSAHVWRDGARDLISTTFEIETLP